jgi:hypothetical protein
MAQVFKKFPNLYVNQRYVTVFKTFDIKALMIKIETTITLAICLCMCVKLGLILSEVHTGY